VGSNPSPRIASTFSSSPPSPRPPSSRTGSGGTFRGSRRPDVSSLRSRRCGIPLLSDHLACPGVPDGEDEEAIVGVEIARVTEKSMTRGALSAVARSPMELKFRTDGDTPRRGEPDPPGTRGCFSRTLDRSHRFRRRVGICFDHWSRAKGLRNHGRGRHRIPVLERA
jgi:hypothetical protein